MFSPQIELRIIQRIQRAFVCNLPPGTLQPANYAAVAKVAYDAMYPRQEDLVIGNLKIHRAKKEVYYLGEEGNYLVPITKCEYDLLHYLASHAGRVCSFKEIIHTIWNRDEEEGKPQLRVTISTLRRKLPADLGNFIQSISALGYMVEKPE